MDLSIIIATYNGRDVLANCLDSLFQAAPACSYEVLVVDDASWDHTSELVAERFPQVRVLRNETNIHYARSNNRALDLARGRFVYLLNNDTIMLPGAIDAMLAFLRGHPAVGAVGSRLLNGDGSVQASVKTLPNIGSALFGARSPIAKLFPGNRFTRRHLLHRDRSAGGPFEAGYVSSASVMIRREVIDRVGYLDERLSYHVDADYCKRIWDAGWSVSYLPSATVVHFDHQGGTMVTRRRRFKSVVEFHRGSYVYFRKHQLENVWHVLHFAVIAGLGVRFVASLLIQTAKEILPSAGASPARGTGLPDRSRRPDRPLAARSPGDQG